MNVRERAEELKHVELDKDLGEGLSSFAVVPVRSGEEREDLGRSCRVRKMLTGKSFRAGDERGEKERKYAKERSQGRT